MAKIICIIDNKTGESQIKAEGYAGETCQQKTRPFIEALGTVTKDQPTEEMYASQEQTQTEQNYGG